MAVRGQEVSNKNTYKSRTSGSIIEADATGCGVISSHMRVQRNDTSKLVKYIIGVNGTVFI